MTLLHHVCAKKQIVPRIAPLLKKYGIRYREKKAHTREKGKVESLLLILTTSKTYIRTTNDRVKMLRLKTLSDFATQS